MHKTCCFEQRHPAQHAAQAAPSREGLTYAEYTSRHGLTQETEGISGWSIQPLAARGVCCNLQLVRRHLPPSALPEAALAFMDLTGLRSLGMTTEEHLVLASRDGGRRELFNTWKTQMCWE